MYLKNFDDFMNESTENVIPEQPGKFNFKRDVEYEKSHGSGSDQIFVARLGSIKKHGKGDLWTWEVAFVKNKNRVVVSGEDSGDESKNWTGSFDGNFADANETAQWISVKGWPDESDFKNIKDNSK